MSPEHAQNIIPQIVVRNNKLEYITSRHFESMPPLVFNSISDSNISSTTRRIFSQDKNITNLEPIKQGREHHGLFKNVNNIINHPLLRKSASKTAMLDPSIFASNSELKGKMNLQSFKAIPKTNSSCNSQDNMGSLEQRHSQIQCITENLQYNVAAKSVMIDPELLSQMRKSTTSQPLKLNVSRSSMHTMSIRENSTLSSNPTLSFQMKQQTSATHVMSRSSSQSSNFSTSSESHRRPIRKNLTFSSIPSLSLQKKRQADTDHGIPNISSCQLFRNASAQIVTSHSSGRLKKQRSLNSSNNFQRINSCENESVCSPKANDTFVNMPKPTLYLEQLRQQNELRNEIQTALSSQDFFIEASEEHYASYKQEIIDAIRKQDISELRRLQQEGWSLQCCNRFGESLVHMACRRGFTEVVDFLIREGNVNLKIKDDYGRTVMHDVCWTPHPNFELMEMILRKEPSLIFRSDSRGHTPLDYVRREHWDLWTKFISSRKHLLFTASHEKELTNTEYKTSPVSHMPTDSTIQHMPDSQVVKKQIINSVNDLRLTKISSESCSELSQKNEVKVNMMKPKLYLEQLLTQHGSNYIEQPALSLFNYFSEPTEEHFSSYKQEIITAIRSQDICKLRLLKKEGCSLQCCNSFRESLVHMACRRGFTEVVEFLIREGHVSLRLRDDYGRTVMHDTCWTPSPNFKLMKMLLIIEPTLLYISDSRGHTPLDYVRPEHWNDWVNFLSREKQLLLQGHETHNKLMESFCKAKE